MAAVRPSNRKFFLRSSVCGFALCLLRLSLLLKSTLGFPIYPGAINTGLSWIRSNTLCQCADYAHHSLLAHNTTMIQRMHNPIEALADLQNIGDVFIKSGNSTSSVKRRLLPLIAKPLIAMPLLLVLPMIAKPLIAITLWSKPLMAKPALAVSLFAKPLILSFALKMFKFAVPVALLRKVKLSMSLLGAALAGKVLLMKGLFVALLAKGAFLFKEKAVEVFATLKMMFLSPVFGILSTLSCMLHSYNCVFDMDVSRLADVFCIPPLSGKCPDPPVCIPENANSGKNNPGVAISLWESLRPVIPNLFPIGLTNKFLVDIPSLLSNGRKGLPYLPPLMSTLEGQSGDIDESVLRQDIPKIPEDPEGMSGVSEYLEQLKEGVLSLEQVVVDVETFQELVGDDIQPLATYMKLPENAAVQEISQISSEELIAVTEAGDLLRMMETAEHHIEYLVNLFEDRNVRLH